MKKKKYENSSSKVGQYSFLLICIVLLFALSPFIQGVVQAKFLPSILTLVILVASLCTISDSKRYFKIASMLARIIHETTLREC